MVIYFYARRYFMEFYRLVCEKIEKPAEFDVGCVAFVEMKFTRYICTLIDPIAPR